MDFRWRIPSLVTDASFPCIEDKHNKCSIEVFFYSSLLNLLFIFHYIKLVVFINFVDWAIVAFDK